MAFRLLVRRSVTGVETGGKLKPAAKGIPRHGGIVEIRAHRGMQLESAAQRGDAVGVVRAHAGHAGFERRAAFLRERRDEFAQLPDEQPVAVRMREHGQGAAVAQHRHGAASAGHSARNVPGLVAIQPAVEGVLRVARMAALDQQARQVQARRARWFARRAAASSRPGSRARFSRRRRSRARARAGAASTRVEMGGEPGVCGVRPAARRCG